MSNLPATAQFTPTSEPDGSEQQLIDRANKLIFDRAGILVPAHKGQSTFRLLCSLSQRHNLPSPEALLNALFANPQHEAWSDFISCFTINHTAFFREEHHFKHLAGELKARGALSIWSAACSTGEEAYSIAMAINEVLGERASAPKVLATDIDEKAVAKALEGVYPIALADRIDELRVRRHFMKGVGVQAGKARVKRSVRERIDFKPFNLNGDTWPKIGPFDVVFCRNTMIYFDRPTQEKLMNRFANVMRPGGLLYVGHSENMSTLTDQFKLLGQTIYKRV